MSRTTAVFLFLIIIALLVIGVAGFVMLGQQVVVREAAVAAEPNTAAHEVDTPIPIVYQTEIANWEPNPTSMLALKVLKHEHFTVGYDEIAKNPAWVSYRLSGPITFHGSEDRPSTFATDFKTAAHVAHRDYSNSGFDRGHLCPAYAIYSRFGMAGMKSTFVMSNVIPQHHGLNAGEWEQLEELVAGRSGKSDGWAGKYGGSWVINGPIYDLRPAADQLKNGTWIPGACFSVVLRQVDGRWDALSFVMPNTKDVRGPVVRYLTTIAVIDRKAQLDLLAGMPVVEKAALEQVNAIALWR